MQYAMVNEDGIVISLEPSVADRTALAVAGGLAADALHIPLASLATDPNVDVATDMAALLTALLPMAAATSPLTGTGVGLIDFASGAVGFLFDVDGLDEFVTALTTAVAAAGVATTEGETMIPFVKVADGALADVTPFSGTATFDGVGVRFNGQRLLVPLSGVAAAATPDATEDPVTDPTAPEAVPADAPAPEAAASTDPVEAAIAPEQVAIGLRVTWINPDDGMMRSGEIVGMDGIESDPPVVSVAPDDDPENFLDLPLDVLDVEDPAADAPEAPEGPEAPEVEVEVEVEVPEAVTYRIEADHPDCVGGPDGPVAVVRVTTDEDGEEEAEVDSCWADEAAAQAYIDSLNAEDPAAAPAPADAPLLAARVAVDVDTSGLERAVSLAERLRGTLDLLGSIEPALAIEGGAVVASSTVVEGTVETMDGLPAPGVQVGPADMEPVQYRSPREVLDEVRLTREDGTSVSASEFVDAEGIDISSIPDDDLIAELARRWAETLVAEAATAGATEPEGGEESVTTATEDPVEAAAPSTVEAAPENPETTVIEEETPTGGALGTAFSDTEYVLEGVLIVEGVPSGDNRMIAEGALTTRNLPLPIMLQTVNAAGHDGSVIAGSIHEIIRVGEKIMFRGNPDSGANGQEMLRLLSEGTMRGISADIDMAVVEFLTEDGQPVSIEEVMFEGVYAMEVLVEGRIMGGTVTPFPAFQEAEVKVLRAIEPDAAMVASGLDYLGDVWRFSGPTGVWQVGQVGEFDLDGALVASGVAVAEAAVEIPVAPPAEWFGIEPGEGMTADQNFTVYADGRCYGLVAKFGTCHIGFMDRCVPVPRSKSNYSHFRTGKVLTAEGTLVPTGTLFMDTDHAELSLKPVAARDHYAHTGCAVADVALYDTEVGVLAAGAMRSDLSPEKQRAFRASQPSPDWRKIGGSLETVGLLAVNTSGFIVPALVASGVEMVPVFRGRFDSVSEEVTALVASGFTMAEPEPEVDDRDATIAALTETVESLHAVVDQFVLRPIREERARAAVERLSTPTRPERERQERLSAAMERFGLTVPVASEMTVAEYVEAGIEAFDAEIHGCGGSCGGSEGACACSTATPDA